MMTSPGTKTNKMNDINRMNNINKMNNVNTTMYNIINETTLMTH